MRIEAGRKINQLHVSVHICDGRFMARTKSPLTPLPGPSTLLSGQTEQQVLMGFLILSTEAFSFLKRIFAQLFRKTQLSFSSLFALRLVHGWKTCCGAFSSEKPCVLSVLRFAVVLIFCVIGCDDDPLWSDRACLNICILLT